MPRILPEFQPFQTFQAVKVTAADHPHHGKAGTTRAPADKDTDANETGFHVPVQLDGVDGLQRLAVDDLQAL